VNVLVKEQRDTLTLTLHSFADDNQLYIHCRIDYVHLSVADLERCVTAIGHCMSANRLKLNLTEVEAHKTELIWTGTRSNLERRIPGGDVSLTLGNDVIPVAEYVRVLGIVITPDLWLDKHVTALCCRRLHSMKLSLPLVHTCLFLPHSPPLCVDVLHAWPVILEKYAMPVKQ